MTSAIQCFCVILLIIIFICITFFIKDVTEEAMSKKKWRKGNLKSFSPIDCATITFVVRFPRLENLFFSFQGKREN